MHQADGVKATVKVLSDTLTAAKPGDKIRIQTARGENEIDLVANPRWSFTIRPSHRLPNCDPCRLDV